ncbi:hypothetical protein Pcinc_033442, partial [Petrolisthes cinctipes]
FVFRRPRQTPRPSTSRTSIPISVINVSNLVPVNVVPHVSPQNKHFPSFLPHAHSTSRVR